MVGGSVSLTVTVNLHMLVLSTLSVAVQLTVVVPTGNVEPLDGAQTTVGVGPLSVAVTVKLTTAPHRPGSLVCKRFAGQVMTGLGSKRRTRSFPLVRITNLPPPLSLLKAESSSVNLAASKLVMPVVVAAMVQLYSCVLSKSETAPEALAASSDTILTVNLLEGVARMFNPQVMLSRSHPWPKKSPPAAPATELICHS